MSATPRPENDIAIEFSADPELITNPVGPATVRLSWKVSDNAKYVVISGLGVVTGNEASQDVDIEQTTTWTLTAYGATFQQINAKQVTVAVTPPLAERLVPEDAIALWSSDTPPPGWVICNAANHTSSSGSEVPDLSDRFIVGASGNVVQPGDAATHTHTIDAFGSDITFVTDFQGAHTHGMPSDWLARTLSSGEHPGIRTPGGYNSGARTSQANPETHQHEVKGLSFGPAETGPNDAEIRPRWYALYYIMKRGSGA